jgi:tetratricopeptide (TPR) repeat protein
MALQAIVNDCPEVGAPAAQDTNLVLDRREIGVSVVSRATNCQDQAIKMMCDKRRCASITFFALAIFAQSAAAQDQKAWDNCIGRDGPLPPDVVIEGCTETIRAAQVPIGKLATAFNNRGVAHKMKGEYKQALQDYDEAIRLLPNSATYYNNRGIIYRLKHDYDRAIANYDEAIWLNSDYPAAFYNRALAYADRGDYDQALADFAVVLRFNPRNALALYARGKMRLKKGDTQEGNADLAVAREIDSNVDAQFDSTP